MMMQAHDVSGNRISTGSSKEHSDAIDDVDHMEPLGQKCNIVAAIMKENDDTFISPNPIENNEESVSESESSTSPQENHTVNEEESPTQALIIGNKESKEVNRFKVVVILILIIVAVVSSTCVFVFIKKAEQNQFEETFHDNALKVLEAVRNSIDNTLMPLDNLAVTLVSHAKAQKSEWPFVTLDDYGVRIAKVLPLTDAIWITLLPVVTPATRLQWENYSRTHDDWVGENFAVQNTWEMYYGPRNLTFDEEGAEVVTGNFGPLESNIRCAFQK
jgi:type II secretory pathway pseudopilin PulG